MRIIAGEHRGRRIEAPEGMATRPTVDRVRESIASSVNSIMGGFDGLRIADVFAGSGALGLECMSRGASFAMFNDSSKQVQRILSANVSALGYSGDDVVLKRIDALKFGIPDTGQAYDVVFLDPPYSTDSEVVLAMIEKSRYAGTISNDSLIVYEHDSDFDESLLADFGFERISQKKYGKTLVDYIKLFV